MACERILAVGLLFLLAACSKSDGKTTSPTDTGSPGGVIELPDAAAPCLGGTTPAIESDAGGVAAACVKSAPEVSFAKDVMPIFKGCTGELCHSWQHDLLANQRSKFCCDHRWLVKPGQPSESLLMQAVWGAGACVPRMPLDGQALSEANITTLTAWICQGANDN